MKLQEKAKKKISYTFTLMILLILIISSLTNNIYASEGTIKYGGSVSYSGSTVGLFHIDGKLAFCMDHEKKSPATGTEIAEKSVYSDQNVIKCLYYGWEGPEQWSGFNGNWEYGIVATSLALDHYIHGSDKTVALDFISFIDNAPFPTSYLNFSNNNFTAYVQGDKQVTNSATINGNEGLSLKFNIPDDVTIVCENRGWNKTGGTVEVVNGDVIHFEAPLTKTGNWTSEQIANSYVWNAILCRSYDDNIQRLVRLGEKDPGTYTNISINFISLGNIELYKTDSKTGALTHFEKSVLYFFMLKIKQMKKLPIF